MLEGMAFSVFEMIEAGSRELNPKFAHTLRGTIADERRHVGFGENTIGALIRQHPEKKSEIEDMQAVLANTVVGEFETRLARIGLEYQAPVGV